MLLQLSLKHSRPYYSSAELSVLCLENRLNSLEHKLFMPLQPWSCFGIIAIYLAGDKNGISS
jgi:hypothetical protein